jgi:hypothetical protein
MHAWWYHIDFIAEGDVLTLHINGLFLAVYFDGHGKTKLQPTIPDIVRIQHILLVMTTVRHAGKISEKTSIVSRYRTANL